MKLGIDASNLRAGGGVTHLTELLYAADPSVCGFSSIIVWGGRDTLQHLEDRSWLEKCHLPVLDKGLPFRAYWQRFLLSGLARQAGCDVLFAPGGTYAGSFHPAVTMSRNLLPFEWGELKRYGMSMMALKWLVLRLVQSHSFTNVDGMIFLTQYARDTVTTEIGKELENTATIPHGINPRFSFPPRHQRLVGDYEDKKPFRIVYVSAIDWYKHQWNAVEAVAQLRKEGFPVTLDLVGPSYAPALARLTATFKRVDPDGEFAFYSGSVPHAEIHSRYASADLCLFASSCENMPNILLEGMASGLPIACSNRGPMPEILQDAGLYFDPESPSDIANAIRKFIVLPELREEKANLSFALVQQYSWRRCADETFDFLAGIVKGSKISKSVISQ
jgi:glycosyltransferase involved in cell wall biosynthesis